jgi:hypothetical protein
MPQTAVRAYENPALDVAAAQARHLGVPLLVVAALLQSHPYATARRYQVRPHQHTAYHSTAQHSTAQHASHTSNTLVSC